MFKKNFKRHPGRFLTTCLAASVVNAATDTTYPDAAASNPATMGWMVGSPPPPDRIIRFADGGYFKFPAMRWSVSNFVN